jgi:hypothetical protein
VVQPYFALPFYEADQVLAATNNRYLFWLYNICIAVWMDKLLILQAITDKTQNWTLHIE